MPDYTKKNEVNALGLPRVLYRSRPFVDNEPVKDIVRDSLEALRSRSPELYGRLIDDVFSILRGSVVIRTSERSFLAFPPDMAPSVRDFLLYITLINYLLYKKQGFDERYIVFSFRDFVSKMLPDKEWNYSKLGGLLQSLGRWNRIYLYVVDPEDGKFYSGFMLVEFETNEKRDKRGYIVDVEVRVGFPRYIDELIKQGFYLIPGWLIELPSYLAVWGMFFFVNVFPFGRTSRYIHTFPLPTKEKGATEFRYLLASWNTEVLGRIFRPLHTDYEEPIPPTLFAGANKITLWVASKKWLYTGGKAREQDERYEVPLVFQLPLWQRGRSRFSGFSYSPAFAFLTGISMYSEEAARLFLLLFEELTLMKGKKWADDVLSHIVQAQPGKARGNRAFAGTVSRLLSKYPQESLISQQFARLFAEHLLKKGFWEDFALTGTRRILHNLAEELKAYVAEYGVPDVEAGQGKVPPADDPVVRNLHKVWEASPAIQELYLRKVLGDKYDTASEVERKAALLVAFSRFVEDMRK